MSYLTKKPGSLEEVISQKTKLEAGYQDKFKKELEKAGKGIGAMTPAEKSAFFKKIDKMHNAKNEEMSKDSAYAIGMAQAKKSKGDEPPLEKSTITKGHEIAKSILKKESLEKSIRNMWQQSADGIEEMKKSAKYLKAQDVAPEEPAEKDKKEKVSEGGPGSGPQKGGAKKSNFTSAQIKQAYGILNDPRYRQGNYSVAVKTINKVSPGLADHPDVKNALKRANEDVEVEKDKKEGYESMVPNKKDDESDKKRKTTMTGEKPSEVEMEPEIKYNK